MGKTIGVISLKGGVGKTSVVASLGAALSEFGKKVLLIDGNLSSPTLGLHLNIIDPEKTLHHVLSRKSNTSEAIYETMGLDVMPSSIFERLEVNPLKLKDRIKGLKRKYDVILIDSSPSLNEETLAVMLASDGLLVVTTPDHPTLSTTLKAVKLARQRGANILGLVMNKVHDMDFELSLDDIEDTLEIPVLAVIPYDVGVLGALSHMEPFTFFKPNSKGSIELKKLAGVLIGQKYQQTRLKDFLRKITPKRQEINREIFYSRVFEE